MKSAFKVGDLVRILPISECPSEYHPFLKGLLRDTFQNSLAIVTEVSKYTYSSSPNYTLKYLKEGYENEVTKLYWCEEGLEKVPITTETDSIIESSSSVPLTIKLHKKKKILLNFNN